MKSKRLFTIGLMVIAHFGFGQREFIANRSCDVITIDGDLFEGGWGCSEEACDFIVSYPKFGDSSEFNSFIRILYDDEALYVGGILYDPQPDSVSYALSQRDDFGNADWFGITIDPYATNQTAFSFMVTAAGVELDAISFIDDQDFTWNAVWRSAAKKRNDGWSFEMKIPFSALRFPNKSTQEWKVNLTRQVRRRREMSYWNPLDPNLFGELTQSGNLVGIKDVKSPLRLSLIPYLTGYLENAYNATTGKQEWHKRITGGMDLKYGINDAFTLDMTLIPDFGQTQSDQQILNLGPFEVRYNENRPFFLEGMDLFRIGDVFYTRRIGGAPFNANLPYEDENVASIQSLPSESPLINAAKVSGRTNNGLGIGVFNALEGRAFALVDDTLGNSRTIEVNPLTNYNVFVLSQNLKNNGSVALVNTNVIRDRENRDANVSVFTGSLFSRDNNYNVNATLKTSTIFEDAKVTAGHSVNAGISKVAGNLRYYLYYGEESDSYDPNDLGFLYNNNQRSYSSGISFYDFDGDRFFLRKWLDVDVYYEELYKPQLFSSLDLSWSAVGTFRNFLTCGFNGEINPLGYVDHFESRNFGKEVIYGAMYNLGGFYSSDYSKKLALDLRANFLDVLTTEQFEFSVTVSPRIRFGDRAFMVWKSIYSHYHQDVGYVSKKISGYEEELILGFRNRDVVENTLSAQFIFTKRMGLDIQFRHYWQQVKYSHFVALQDEGELLKSDYFPLNDQGESAHNTSYNAFTLDVNYRWVFFPGSEVRIVYKNNIFHSKEVLDESYFSTFDALFEQPQLNSISLKLLVYVDALYFKKRKSRSN